jgi:putative serine protease PepD
MEPSPPTQGLWQGPAGTPVQGFAPPPPRRAAAPGAFGWAAGTGLLPAPSTPRRARTRPPWALVLATVAALAVCAAFGLVGWRMTGLEQRQAADRRVHAGALAQAERRADAQAERADALEARLRAVEARVQAQADPVKIASLVQRSVFTVESARGQGSAFVLAAGDGSATLITNYHVVAGSRQVLLRRDGLRLTGLVVRVDEAADLAAIEVDRNLPALARAMARPAVGDPVVSVGSPLGLGGTVTTGVVSALRPGQIQFSAPVSPGNSGGPLVDRAGRVIGVTVAKYVAEGAEGLSFAVPVQAVCAQVLAC